MPVGPQGQLRPDDVIACAVKVCQIATGEVEETLEDQDSDSEDPDHAERSLEAQKSVKD